MDFTLTIQACVVGMVLAAFLMAGRMRLASLAALYAVQAALLALAIAAYAVLHADSAAYAVAAAVFILKAGLIPRWLVRTVRAHGASERLAAYAKPTLLSFGALLAIAFAGIVARTLAATAGAPYVALASSVSLVLIGFLMLISRTDMMGLGFGFLVVENGVFTLGLALTGGMPLFVELGVLFDLSVLLLLLIAFARRAQREHASLATDYLRELIG